jgi:hypothetical protein
MFDIAMILFQEDTGAVHVAAIGLTKSLLGEKTENSLSVAMYILATEQLADFRTCMRSHKFWLVDGVSTSSLLLQPYG